MEKTKKIEQFKPLDPFQPVDSVLNLEDKSLIFLGILKSNFQDVNGLENPFHLSDLDYYLPSDKRTKKFVRVLKHKDKWICVASGFRYLKRNFYKYKDKIIVFGNKNLSEDLEFQEKIDRLLPKEMKYKLYFYELENDKFDCSNFYISLILCQILCEDFYIEDINGIKDLNREKIKSDFDECIDKTKIFNIKKKYVGRFDTEDMQNLINDYVLYLTVYRFI